MTGKEIVGISGRKSGIFLGGAGLSSFGGV